MLSFLSVGVLFAVVYEVFLCESFCCRMMELMASSLVFLQFVIWKVQCSVCSLESFRLTNEFEEALHAFGCA